MSQQIGTFKAKISDAFMGVSKEKRTPYFCIMFKTEDGTEYPWQVYLHNNFSNEQAKEVAQKNIETVARLGFKGSRISDLAEGTIDDLFAKIDDDIKIVVDEEKYEKKDKDGTVLLDESGNPQFGTKFFVKFVNVGTGYEKIDKKQAVVLTKSLPYDGWLAPAKKNNPIKPENQNKTTAGFTTDDIPF